MTTPIKWGEEFLVNTTTSNSQNYSTTAALRDGRFIVTWLDRSGSVGDLDWGVRAQLFDETGKRVGVEFLVNTTTAGLQFGQSIASLSGGGFVVTWADKSGTEGRVSVDDVRAQVFDANGRKVGAEFLVNTITNNDQNMPSVTSLSNGGFVITWQDASGAGNDASSLAVHAQIFASDGSKTGSEFLVNTTTFGMQSDPAVIELSNGHLVITWTDGSQTGDDTSGTAVRAQIFDASGGMVVAEFLINTTTNGYQSSPDITALAGGGFVATWLDVAGEGEGIDLSAQVFGANGQKVGQEFKVDALLSGQLPSICGLADGRFVVVWSESTADGSSSAILGQLFNPDGTKVDGEFLINTTTIGGHIEPSVAALPDGRFVVSWSDSSGTGGDTSGYAIRSQILDPRLESVELGGTASADNLAGTQFDDWLSGQAGNDMLYGVGGDDLLIGGAGNDNLYGGTGADWMRGGLGNDFYVVDDLADRVFEQMGQGNDRVSSSVTHSLSVNIESLTLTGSGAIDGTGNSLANTIVGNGAANYLRGGDGADKLSGAGGADTLDGGIGADSMTGGAGNDTYWVDDAGDAVVEALNGGLDSVVTARSYVLTGNVEQLTLTGLAGVSGTGNAIANTLNGNEANNNLSGLVGNDTLKGNGGADRLNGGLGADRMEGGAGADVYVVDNIGDVVVEAAVVGRDRVESSINFTLGGNLEDLRLTGLGNINGTGNTANNALTGNAGNNLLVGESGSDVLDGGAGNDGLSGGAGADAFVFRAGYGLDRVVDFADNVDTLRLDDNLWGGGLTVAQMLSFYASVSSGNVVLTFGADVFTVVGLPDVNALQDDILII